MEGLGFNSRYHKKCKIPNKQLNMRKQIRGVKKNPTIVFLMNSIL